MPSSSLIRPILSSAPIARSLPSEENQASKPPRGVFTAEVRAGQSKTADFSPPLTQRNFPSGLNRTELSRPKFRRFTSRPSANDPRLGASGGIPEINPTIEAGDGDLLSVGSPRAVHDGFRVH